eukprot:TRINITY_DN257_c0_g2_i1.p2 TRINITY_DN257_c0_g2~~TRINITY_DN257_c0_g2_i1.p2  ORF type:complete len:133 (+),score=9.17 TRINITY_DN257_c0_g2_i1:329-727(+)
MSSTLFCVCSACMIDFFIFIPAAGFTLYKGYNGACRRPVEKVTIIWYRVCQIILCGCWLGFSIGCAGPFDGWTQIKHLKRQHAGGAKFCIFLTVLEALGYTAACVLGVIGVLVISQVSEEEVSSQFPMPSKV